MEKKFSLVLAGALAGLATAGFVLKQKKLLGLMNIDTSHSVIRAPLVATLAYGGTAAPLKTTRKILLIVGGLYFLIGAIGIKDRRIFGLLPSGLTAFDQVYHFSVGAAATWLGSRGGRMLKP